MSFKAAPGINKKNAASLCFAMLLALILVQPFLCGCVRNDSVSRDGFYFDTYISIKLFGCKDSEKVLDEAFALCAHYDALFDAHTSDSDIARINSSHGEPTEVDEETASLIKLGLEYSGLSGGVFDISCGALTSLWDFSSESPALPQQSDIDKALDTISWQTVTVENNLVTVPYDTKLDAGGIAKGYVADCLAEYLQSAGAKNAIIDLGGNVLAIGKKNGRDYHIAVRSPFNSESSACVLSVSDMSVVTAGSYERGFELDGEYYHHILDLETGMPSKSGLVSATIISESSVQGDALSTTCFLLGGDRALELIESIESAECILICEDGTTRFSSGAEKYVI